VLKSAAKTFTKTPSILKKRNREFLCSPLSEKRKEKRFEEGDGFLNLANDFSRLEVMFDECWNLKEDDKENTESIKLNSGGESKTTDGDVVTDSRTVEVSGILVERKTNETTFISPDLGIKPEAAEKFGHRISKTSSIKSASPIPPLEITSCSQKSCICGGTPLWRSIESPLAWKSPCNSFVPGPRVDTDITIEDIGYFTSPSERSYDALGLMKQLSEHTAAAFADAQQVLGDETPDSILSKRSSSINAITDPDLLIERRVLNFSDSVTPGKRTETVRFLSSKNHHQSPTSYLLKGCR
jgi:myb proto-oncogene protein